MTRRVSPGEPIRPHMTAAWFNSTLKTAVVSGKGSVTETRHHNEAPVKFIPSEDCVRVDRFTAVAPVGALDSDYGDGTDRTQYVTKEAITRLNWIIAQNEMGLGYENGEAVYAGITWAKVTILDNSHNRVDINLDTLELFSSTTGKGLILRTQGEYTLISIGELVGSSTTSTTTTTDGLINSPCEGTCRYEVQDGAWVLTTNTCAPTTSTTTTTTTTTTTSTTTSEGDTSTTTTPDNSRCRGTTTTTTTPEIECNCLHPDFCPTSDTDITFTSCSIGMNQSICETTTSTTCDCNTTTTGDLGCRCGYRFITLPNGAQRKVDLRPCPPGCECVGAPQPAPCDPNPCEQPEFLGHCVCDGPEPCGDCLGRTWWLCEYNCDGVLAWQGWSNCYLSSIDCYGPNDCRAERPTIPCTQCGDQIETGCVAVARASTTTTPDFCCSGPCSVCYGCPTTTTSTTTTGECTAPCLRKYNGTSWDIISSTCASPCYCSGVPVTGQEVGEIVQVPCINPPPTTTTTTTTSTTTTCANTCDPAAADTSVWQCRGGAWSEVDSACAEGLSPTVPESPCSPGEQCNCATGGCDTTTTTTSTTSTTTTCSNTCSAPASGSSGWQCVNGTWVEKFDMCELGGSPVEPEAPCNELNQCDCADVVCATTSTTTTCPCEKGPGESPPHYWCGPTGMLFTAAVCNNAPNGATCPGGWIVPDLPCDGSGTCAQGAAVCADDTTTSTTTTSEPTTGEPGTTTTTTTTSEGTSSTTTNCGFCIWTWNSGGSFWQRTTFGCASGCAECPSPSVMGPEADQTTLCGP